MDRKILIITHVFITWIKSTSSTESLLSKGLAVYRKVNLYDEQLYSIEKKSNFLTDYAGLLASAITIPVLSYIFDKEKTISE